MLSHRFYYFLVVCPTYPETFIWGDIFCIIFTTFCCHSFSRSRKRVCDERKRKDRRKYCSHQAINIRTRQRGIAIEWRTWRCIPTTSSHDTATRSARHLSTRCNIWARPSTCCKTKHNLYSAEYSASAALYVKSEPAYSLHRRPSQHSRTLACSGRTIRCRSLPFNGLHFRKPCKCMDYYSLIDTGGMKGWVGLVIWPTEDSLPTKWSSVNHISGTGQGKSASQEQTS